MKASELIKALGDLVGEHGDLEVLFIDPEGIYAPDAIDGVWVEDGVFVLGWNETMPL
jgi:hypothetical protein